MKLGKTKLVANKNQDHPLLNYLVENTPSTLKKNSCCLKKNLNKKFELGRFELLSIFEIRPCYTCRTFVHALELHIGNHGPTTQRGE
jgi:hypothetical protein